MQTTFALRSGQGVAVTAALTSRQKTNDIPILPANSPGLARNAPEGQARPSRVCPGASLVLERLPQERLLSSRGSGTDSTACVNRRSPQRYLQCYAWAPIKSPVPAPVPDPLRDDDFVLQPLPPQEFPAEDLRIGSPFQRTELVSHPPTLAPVYAPVPDVLSDEGLDLKPLPPQESPLDDPRLGNPLKRMARVNTSWMGVVLEYEGVVVEDNAEFHSRAWAQVAEEEGKPRPLHFALKRAQGMKDEQVVQEVFCWSRTPLEVRRLAAKKDEIFRSLLGSKPPVVAAGVRDFLDTLSKNDVPAALATSSPEARVMPALKQAGLEEKFVAIIAAEDVHRGRPDPEGYLYAAQKLERPPSRTVVVGNSNQVNCFGAEIIWIVWPCLECSSYVW
eukprot:jgi/Botrbrau1/76/Bobra.0022s0066.2